MHDDTIIVPLTQGRVAIVDAEDAERILTHKWYLAGRGYASRNRRASEPPDAERLMHRIILSVPPGFQVDHINGNKLDNRRANLRIVTNAQNNQNCGPHRGNSSGFRGVTWDKARGLWMASICADGCHFNLGRFATAEEAARARDRKAREVHGEFAHLNFPDTCEAGPQSE
jgi:hypothetical protein